MNKIVNTAGPSSLIQGKSIPKYEPACDLCNEINGGDCHFKKNYGSEIESRIIFRTSNFLILPTIGQVVEGHLLIMPIEHCTSAGSLSSGGIKDIEILMNKTRMAFKSAYNKLTIFFEHGIACGLSGSGGCGINHMHLHAIPCDSDLNLLRRASRDYNFENIGSLEVLRELHRRGLSYLLYIDQQGIASISVVDKLPSQYMRIILAKDVGFIDWDWRIFNREERLLSAYKKLSRIFLDID